MKLIVITGDKNSGKDYLASKLSECSDIKYVRPYSDKRIPLHEEVYECSYIPLHEKKLTVKMEHEVPLFTRIIGENRYVVFRNQLNKDYIVLILDTKTLDALRKDYDECEVYTIYCTQSSCDDPEKYDAVVNPYDMDIESLEVSIRE